MEQQVQARYIQRWRDIFKGFEALKAFAVFSHGSVVIFKDPPGDVAALEAKAVEKMAKFGPVMAGTPAGDFNVMKVKGLFTTQLFGARVISRNLDTTLYTPR